MHGCRPPLRIANVIQCSRDRNQKGCWAEPTAEAAPGATRQCELTEHRLWSKILREREKFVILR
jgi:hypothetical protein